MISDRKQAYDKLYEFFENEAFSNLVIRNHETSGFVSALFYGTITYVYTIDFLIKHICKTDCSDMDPSTRTVIRMGAWQILFSEKVPPFAACNTSVELIKEVHPQSSSFVNGVLRKLVSEKDNISIDSFKPEIRTSLKPEIFGVLKKSYGKDRALSIGEALLRSPRISVRPNRMKISADDLIDTFRKEGVNAVRSSVIDDALIIEGANIERLQSFKDGLFFVQNEAAQMASVVASPDEGMKILDTCAAPGGKSTHLAELTNDKADILSLDINESRLKLIDDNSRRLGLKSVHTMKADSTDLKSTLGDRSFDLVLCDVPCSGLGLMARKPDIRLTITYDRINELLPKQKTILTNSSIYVRPGGVLVYSTCTLNKAENEETIQYFLEHNKDFVTCDITDRLPKSLIMDNDRIESARNGMLTLYPDIDGCDGFFICRMERRA